MVWATSWGGKRRRDKPGCLGCPPVCLPERFLTTGLGAPGGLAEGGIEELEAFCTPGGFADPGPFAPPAHDAARADSAQRGQVAGRVRSLLHLAEGNQANSPKAKNPLSGYRADLPYVLIEKSFIVRPSTSGVECHPVARNTLPTPQRQLALSACGD